VASQNTLGIERTANVLWNKNEAFDFQIMSSPEQLDSAIKDKFAGGNTARLAAGFCWPWSGPNRDGSLVR